MEIYEALYTTPSNAATEARPHPLRCPVAHPRCRHSRTPHRRGLALNPWSMTLRIKSQLRAALQAGDGPSGRCPARNPCRPNAR